MDPDSTGTPPQTDQPGFSLATGETGLTLHIPPLPDPLVIAIWALGLGALLFIALMLINAWTNRQKTWPWITKRWRGIIGILQRNYLTILIPLGFLLIGWAFAAYIWQIPFLIGQMLTKLKTEIAGADTQAIRNIGYTFAALAGMLAILATIPFQLVRVWINERTAKTQEANLTTGLINTAVEGLGADKTVSRIGRTVIFTKEGEDAHGTVQWRGEKPPKKPGEGWKLELGEWKTYDTTEPNIEVRVGAILTLDRISRTNPEEHIRVMDILCTYIRENAPAKDAKDLNLDDTFEDSINSLSKPRTDIQTALTTLGNREPQRIENEEKRRTQGGETGYRLDLRETNLRKSDLSHLNLNRARLNHARMEGADLREARILRADLSEAQIQGADLSETQMGAADLEGARMERADLSEARIEGANLRRASMNGAGLRLARMEGADLRLAQMGAADLWGAQMKGADLGGAQMQDANLRGARMQGTDLRWARMERADLCAAQMQDANLSEARMQGANIRDARLEESNLWKARMEQADFTGADLRSAYWSGAQTALIAHFADLRGAQDLTQAQLDQMIGNEHTLLPDHLAPDTGRPYSIPTCWKEPPEALVIAMKRVGYDWEKDPDGYCCPPGEEPQRTGKPLALNKPYPPGHPLAERD
ncbi:pentapeptide repeat-containing protein [Amaricoccus macauensis]|uniref:pentapeptide repeat-containing protein n=1 Tax=Amaricoccus macauensis TaxID=57001 RepID=UPI003C7DAA7B